MDSLFAKLNKNDIELIDEYRLNSYDVQETEYGNIAKISHILRFWDSNKRDLYKLLGNNFIISKPIEIKTSIQILEEQVIPLYDHPFVKYVTANINDPYVFKSCILTRQALANNKIIWYGHLIINGKTYEALPDMKLMKFLSRIAVALDIQDMFEDFRIAHSQILNTKTLKCELCLSIHPLDYMTMSDNDNNWSSCMSWMRQGCYRMGTIEMMNSPKVVVAYLKSDNKTLTFDDYTWNSKRWRELFIIDDKVLAGVKPYPFKHNELEILVLNWLKELAEKNLGWVYGNTYYGMTDPIIYISETKSIEIIFETNLMYNDCYRHTQPIYIAEDLQHNYLCNYSGPAVCIKCGRIEHLSTNDEEGYYQLCCDKCNNGITCDICYDITDDPIILEDGREVCHHCAQTTVVDFITGEVIKLTDSMKVIVMNYSRSCNEYPFRTVKYIHSNSSIEAFQLLVNNKLALEHMQEAAKRRCNTVVLHIEDLTLEYLDMIKIIDF